jgi:hypothetical protein
MLTCGGPSFTCIRVCVCFLNIFKLLHDSTFVAWTALDHGS